MNRSLCSYEKNKMCLLHAFSDDTVVNDTQLQEYHIIYSFVIYYCSEAVAVA